jgi:predicted P-loop ATPase
MSKETKTLPIVVTAPKPPALLQPKWPERSAKGAPLKGSMMNVRMAIEALELDCRYDLFLDRYTINGQGMTQFVGQINDKTARAFREYCFQRTRYEPGSEAAREGLLRACESRMFNSLQDYLDGVHGTWDGRPRLDTWLTTYLGVEDSPLHREWGRLFLMGACRRVYDPGCKFDFVLVFEGAEGEGKSTAVKVLACGKGAEDRPEYFSDSTILDKDERAQMELTKGVWFYELSEMSGASRADQKKLKAFITRQEERARPAYGYFKENQPRIALFVGTINTDPNSGDTIEYLNRGDRRRWAPLRTSVVSPIDIPGLIRDRDQLFAEAMFKAMDPISGWCSLALDPALYADATAEQIAREIPDTFEDILSPLFDNIIAWDSDKSDGELWQGPPRGKDMERGFFVNDMEVRVAAWKVLEQLPAGASTIDGGRRVPGVMAKLGWQRVRSADTRWYKKARPVVAE